MNSTTFPQSLRSLRHAPSRESFEQGYSRYRDPDVTASVSDEANPFTFPNYNGDRSGSQWIGSVCIWLRAGS
ncbi:MAG: hypothetical protein JWQ98_2035 [Chlorobi bacterium]|nr:hypothetical protein [Chlorobiota bacterium]